MKKLLPLLLSVISVFSVVILLQADDSPVVQAAKTEKARRKTIPHAHRTFTNKDIRAFKIKHNLPDNPADSETQTQSAPAEDQDPEMDQMDQQEKYWRNRFQQVQNRILQAHDQIDLLHTQINDQEKYFYTLPDGDQKQQVMLQINELTHQLQKAQDELNEANQALDDLQEEGRLAGALPGWLRE